MLGMPRVPTLQTQGSQMHHRRQGPPAVTNMPPTHPDIVPHRYPQWGVPPSTTTIYYHQTPLKPSKSPLYSIYNKVYRKTKLHGKCQFPILYSRFWLFATHLYGMLGQEFWISSYPRNEYPVWITTWISTPVFSSILAPGYGTRTFPNPPPSNAIRTPFKRGRNGSPSDALNAHIQRIYPTQTKRPHA